MKDQAQKQEKKLESLNKLLVGIQKKVDELQFQDKREPHREKE